MKSGSPQSKSQSQSHDPKKTNGFTSNDQMRIMRGDFAHMRNMGSAKTWALEMVNFRYSFLRQIDHIIKTPEQAFGARNGKQFP